MVFPLSESFNAVSSKSFVFAGSSNHGSQKLRCSNDGYDNQADQLSLGQPLSVVPIFRVSHNLHLQITAKNLQGVVHAVDVAALIAVADIDTGTDETVTDVETGPEGGFHVRAVAGIDVHRVVGTGFLGGIDELAHHFIAVGAAGVLGQVQRLV